MASPPPITDSPLFWLLLFGSVGLVLLTAIEPKFALRQERIERMHESRELGRQRTGTAIGDREARTVPETPVWQPTRQATLRPLMLFVAGMLVVAMGILHVRRRRLAKEAERNAEHEDQPA
ncbi:MAG TPA: hypothetical protein VHC22_13050 [Pirellulales bacterium]|nr:hypothetical protein [Pirellulales bacterium]